MEAITYVSESHCKFQISEGLKPLWRTFDNIVGDVDFHTRHAFRGAERDAGWRDKLCVHASRIDDEPLTSFACLVDEEDANLTLGGSASLDPHEANLQQGTEQGKTLATIASQYRIPIRRRRLLVNLVRVEGFNMH